MALGTVVATASEPSSGWVPSVLLALLGVWASRKIIMEVRMAGEQTRAALDELSGAIDEVAGEMDDLAERLDAADGVDASVAAEVRDKAARLRGLRADAPVEEPAGGGDGAPLPSDSVPPPVQNDSGNNLPDGDRF